MSGLSKSTSDNNTQTKTKQNGASSLDPDTGKFSPITDPDAWSLDKALRQLPQKQETEATGWVNSERIGYELNRYFDDVSEFNFEIDEDILSMRFPTSSPAPRGSGVFDEFLPSTRENPFGLHNDRRAYVDFYAKNLTASIEDGFKYSDLSFYEQQHYEMVRDQHVESFSGPQLRASNPDFEASQRQLATKQKAFFAGQRWDQRVAQGINDSAMLAAFRYHPGKFMAAQAGYSLGNLDKPWVASGLNDLYGADIRLAAGFKNEQRKFEAKLYSGTDSHLNASWKSGRIEFKQNGLKGNVSQHYQLKNIFDLDSFQVVNVGEVEMANALKVPGFNVGKVPVKSSLTPGVRVNLDNLNVRGSFNYKFELPKHLQPFGWTPSIGVEIRK